MRERLLIVGNGMASVRLLERLVALAPQRYAITVVGAEPAPGYNRVLLSALLAGDVAEADVVLREREWYARNGIRLISGEEVVALDASARVARLADGGVIAFDQCVIATGSQALKLPVPGMDLPGVITFRDLPDVATMEGAAIAEHRVAVIGGGLLGIEAAHGLAKRGAQVTLVHVMDRLMERQLDARAAAIVRRALERRGVRVLLERRTVAVAREDAATGLSFDDGSAIAADLVVCAIGIRPNVELAAAAGLAVKRGIVVDDGMAASLPGFHAIGECAEHRGMAYGLVEPAYAQAEVLARRLAGEEVDFDGLVPSTNLKVSGLPVFSAGDFLGGEGHEIATLHDTQGGYRKLVFAGGRLAGCVLVGETEDALWYLDLIRSGADVTAARRLLIHGRDFAEPALAGGLKQAA